MTGVLAIDGGQSGIRARWSGSPDVVEVPGVSRQEGDIVAAVADAAVAAWTRLSEPAVQRVVLGLTTAPTDDPGMTRLASLVASAVGADDVMLCDDTVTAHAGALAGGWGVSLRAGTGVACLAVGEGPHAPAVVVDGHGYLLGDDGAGYWIGREGLRAVLRSVDGRGGPTALRSPAEGRFGPLDQLHVTVHDLLRPVHEIAGFAPAVLEAAAGGDAAAEAIATAAAGQLAVTAATAVARVDDGSRLPIDDGGPVPVALGGRLLERSALLHDRVVAALAERAPHAEVRDAAGDPLAGALGLGTGMYPNRYGALIHHWSATNLSERASLR